MSSLNQRAADFLRTARRTEASQALPAFFPSIKKLRGSLKNLHKAAAGLKNCQIGPTLLDGVAPGSIKLEAMQAALREWIARFADSAKAVAIDRDCSAEFCDELDAVCVFEKLPHNCAQSFGLYVKDLVRTLGNTVAQVESLWSRTSSAEDSDEDIDAQLAIMHQLHGRLELEYVLKFVSPEARLCFNVFVHEVKVAVAAWRCKKTRIARLENKRSVNGMMSALVLGDPCEDSKAGGGAKPRATRKKRAAT